MKSGIRSEYVLIVMILFVVQMQIVVAQEAKKECKAKYEVDAGPAIDVCEGGSVGLSGVIGGDVARVVWRGGKGKFSPNRESLTAEYTPDLSEYGDTLILTLVGDNPNYPDCPKGRANMVIRVNLQPKVEAGNSRKVCVGEPVHLAGKVIAGKAKEVKWSSDGAGKFDDSGKENAVYTPNENDAARGAVRLTFKAIPYGVCLPDSETIALTVTAAPDIRVPELISGKGISPVSITAQVKDEVQLKWSTEGSGTFNNDQVAGTIYTPSDADVKKGNVNLILKASTEGGCHIEKKIVLKISSN